MEDEENLKYLNVLGRGRGCNRKSNNKRGRGELWGGRGGGGGRVRSIPLTSIPSEERASDNVMWLMGGEEE